MNKFIIGSDEVGYGSFAGPICVGAVRAPTDWNLEGLNDSKQLSKKKREVMSAKLIELANKGEIWFSIGERSNLEIDTSGLAMAQKECYIDAIKAVWDNDCQVIVDGVLKLPADKIDLSKVKSVIKADTTVPTVMAASILAKVYRDHKMYNLHNSYPEYDFISNVGYSSPKHQKALVEFGPCAIHRFSYKPIKALMEKIKS